MSKSSTTTTESDWLHNPHAGEILASEFMEPLGIAPDAIAAALGVAAARVEGLISGRIRIDADLDLRLARYFRMSEGFFLGLQDDFELLEAKRRLNGELERIVPRAA